MFKAPFLPWVLLAFSFVLHNTIPKDEICGIVVGHIFYFFSDVFPPMHDGMRPLDPPQWWIRLFERRQDAITETDDGGTHEDIGMGGRDLAGVQDVR